MVNFVPFLTKSSANAIDKAVGKAGNKAATPVNSFIGQVNNVFGTKIPTINPVGALKKGAVAGIKSVLGNTAPDLSPKATDGQAIRSQVIKVSERFGGRLNKTSPVATTGEAMAQFPVVSEMAKRFDPVTNFEWMAVIRGRGASAKTELPWYYIDDITLPAPNFESTQKYINGKEIKYADMFSVNNCTIKIYSDISGLAFNYCNAWCRSIFRDDNLHQLPSVYKKDIWVFILDAKRNVVTDIQLLGCWPTAWADYQLVGNAAAALETSLTLSVDDFKMNYNDDPQAIANVIQRATSDGTFDGSGAVAGAGGGYGSQDISQSMLENVIARSGPINNQTGSPGGDAREALRRANLAKTNADRIVKQARDLSRGINGF
jgi:hypothetical protein